MYLMSIASILLLGAILGRAVRNAAFRHYRLFYGYLAFVLVTSLIHLVLIWTIGRASPVYALAYALPTYVMPVWQIWILWEIHRRIIGNTKTHFGYAKTSWKEPIRLTMIAGALTLPVAWGIAWQEGGSLFDQYHTLTLFLQMSLCVLVCREATRARRELDLGQNLKGILLGLSLIVGCQALNFVTLVFTQAPAQVFWFFVQFIYFTALIVFTYTLWDYAPISRPDPSYQHRLERTNRALYDVLKSALLNRR